MLPPRRQAGFNDRKNGLGVPFVGREGTRLRTYLEGGAGRLDAMPRDFIRANPMTRITVGIPTFNRPDWLRTSIASVLSQTLTDFHLIVSDNASDDATRDVVQTFRDDRIEYVRSDRNLGAVGNLNRLIDLTQTDFLVLLPDDDVLYPQHLCRSLRLLQKSPNIGLAHSAYNVINAQDRVIRRVSPISSASTTAEKRPGSALEQLIGSPSWLGFASIAYRTRAIAEAGGFRAEDEPLGDRKLWMRIALNWEFAYSPEPLAGVREHTSSLTWRIAGEDGERARLAEMARFYAEEKYRGRTAFIDETAFDVATAIRLRALAELQYVNESAILGAIPAHAMARKLTGLVHSYPAILRQRAFWHLVAAQAGGRRLRSVIHGARARNQKHVVAA